MRLIDKDEILKRKADVYDKNGHLLYAVPTGEIWAAKTVGAVPVVHGRWIKRGYACGESEYKCSVCGETEWRTTCERMKYCMFCGAKMDGEADG